MSTDRVSGGGTAIDEFTNLVSGFLGRGRHTVGINVHRGGTEAEKHLGYPYVWGGKSPTTSFDCSGYVSWVINHSGWNYGRLGVMGLEDICTPVSAADAQPGDLVFFIGTYDAPYPNRPTHVGIYVGNGQMIHCSAPISYTSINTTYWQNHLYGFGHLSEP